MAASRRRLALALAASTIALGGIAAGCGDDDSGTGTAGGVDGASLSGNIAIDGSSTVGPLTSAAAEAFNAENSGVDVTVGTSGTGGGFEVFCKGETAISNASREIKDEEAAVCKKGGIEYEEIRVASDGITLVTKKGADIGGTFALTSEQLKAIWAPKSTIKNWADVPGGGFTDQAMALAGPGSQSGTYDFFNETILGEDAAGEVIEPRQDYAASEDDNNTITAVESSPAALGYFGYTYYEENQDKLELFSVDGVTPSSETITDGSYPLSRPLFIYVSKKEIARPEVLAFVKYYVENATRLAEEQLFVPAPQESIDADLTTLATYE
jgi:phosphate transport system substrate-binding protein